MQKRCPINEMKFIKKGSQADAKKEKRNFNTQFEIEFSKSSDSYPLSEFIVG